MTATWHPSKGFEPLEMRLFIGASYASAAHYPIDVHNVIDIGLHVIKHCGMYAKEYKNWISCKNAVPPIVETIDSFKEYWADAIALVNQTAVLASQHGCMTLLLPRMMTCLQTLVPHLQPQKKQ
jgi:hypothetical protein